MAYKISETCTNCGCCEGSCPVGAINEFNGKHVIDKDMCIHCGACASNCPLGAPVPEPSDLDTL